MENLNDLKSSAKLRRIAFIVLIFCLVAIFFSSFNLMIAKSHDVKRRADIKILSQALDLYHDKYGHYPESDNDQKGWDLTYGKNKKEAHFLDILKEEKILDKIVADPVNNASFFYRYQKYPAGSFGCHRPFYILQIMNFEFPTDNTGRGICPETNWEKDAPNGYTVQAFD
ncbi:MAG: hypothetical protein PHR36_02025 [Patescibacteria group bacterium]|nr:hypothetical protein [Patescibacteria group bacterium]